MDNFRKKLKITGVITLSILSVFSSLSCVCQSFTTRAPKDIGMTGNYDFYVFWPNDVAQTVLAMSFTNDTIHVCPYIVNTPDKVLFKAVTSLEMEHYYNYVSHGEIIQYDSAGQDTQRRSHTDSGYLKTPPDLKKVGYKGGDGSSVKQAIIIKRANNLTEGIAAEYAYLEKELGHRGTDWKPLGQYLHPGRSNRYDVIQVNILHTNKIKYYWFDITGFWG